jgi:hypothetical protein
LIREEIPTISQAPFIIDNLNDLYFIDGMDAYGIIDNMMERVSILFCFESKKGKTW